MNIPEEYVSALRGDGHEVVSSRSVPALGSEATDEAIVSHAEAEGLAELSTEIKDLSDRTADAAILVAPQDMTGSEVRAAVARLEALPFDPRNAEPVWLTTL